MTCAELPAISIELALAYTPINKGLMTYIRPLLSGAVFSAAPLRLALSLSGMVETWGLQAPNPRPVNERDQLSVIGIPISPHRGMARPTMIMRITLAGIP